MVGQRFFRQIDTRGRVVGGGERRGAARPLVTQGPCLWAHAVVLSTLTL